MQNLPIFYHEHFKKISSTHTHARSCYDKLRPNYWILYSADEQSDGIGSSGRQWFSPAGVNIYATYSFLLPHSQLEKLSLITHTASLQVSKLLEEENISSKIKWVNDVLVDGKKICGILAESSLNVFTDDAGLNYAGVLVSVGLNVNADSLQLRDALQPATSIFIIKGKKCDLKNLLDRLSNLIMQGIITLITQGFGPVREQILPRLERFGQKPIVFRQTDGTYKTGIITTIGHKGELILQTQDETFESFYSGQIIKPVIGND